VTAFVRGLRGEIPLAIAAEEVRTLEERAWPVAVAAMYAALGARDDALRVMEEALSAHGEDVTVMFAPLPVFRTVMTDSRYRAMLESLGISILAADSSD
jgi:hypothetical protein